MNALIRKPTDVESVEMKHEGMGPMDTKSIDAEPMDTKSADAENDMQEEDEYPDAPLTYDQMLVQVTSDFLDSHRPPKDEEEIGCAVRGIIDETNLNITLRNELAPKGDKWKLLTKLTNLQNAICLMAWHDVSNIEMKNGGSDGRLLGLYQKQGPKGGLYDIRPDAINQIARQYNMSLTTRDLKEIAALLADLAPIKGLSTDKDLVPVNNGVYNCKTHLLQDFSPEQVFLSKCAVNYKQNAGNPVIENPDGTEWDVDSWMRSLVDDHPDADELTDLLWKIIGASVRYLVPWNKLVLLSASSGNNGKGTLCQLIRNVVGEDACISISLDNFSRDFLLQDLPSKQTVICDENRVGLYLDSLEMLKAVVTGDTIQINRKYLAPIQARFRGLVIECVNERPNFRDKTDSMYRRTLFVPMTKCFTGAERKYIKEDYIARPEVLEYVLFKVLNMDYYELPEPESCKIELEVSREMNDPILQFMNDVFDELTWDLVPFVFLYDLFRAWYAKAVPGKAPLSRVRFISELKGHLHLFPDWELRQDEHGKDMSMRSKDRMGWSETLILQYDLEDWKNPTYKGNNPNNMCIPCTKPSYRGIIRKSYVTKEVLAKEDQEELDKIMQLNSKANIVNSATEYATESQANTN